jgi:acyl-ACP--UDP-N-acetylglucosamine O-acyltransferase
VAASAVILGNTRIGAGCQIHSHAVIGDIPQDHAFDGSDSYCLIGDECTIREGATIHRGTAPGSATIVGDRCFLMTNSHVAHNCEIGNDVTLVSGALLAGYVRVGARAVISGNAAVHQFVRVGELAMIDGLYVPAKNDPWTGHGYHHYSKPDTSQVQLPLSQYLPALRSRCARLGFRQLIVVTNRPDGSAEIERYDCPP